MVNSNYDELDTKILANMRENCKQNLKELANKLAVHPNTLMQRVKKLEKEGVIIKYTAEIDYTKLGYDLDAMIMVKVNKDTRTKWYVLNDLKAIKDINILYTITGNYDVMAIVKTKNRETLTALLAELNKKQYIVETNTTVLLYSFKHAYEFNPLI